MQSTTASTREAKPAVGKLAAHGDADACRREASQGLQCVAVRQADFLDCCQIDARQSREPRRGADQPGWLALRREICWFIVQKSYRTPIRKSPPVSR